ncbi:MAG: hypothetical protein JST12_19000 [Armatimonadetes bacterium]|nr:hypothetical protein [Armatimonadota bacterium]
MVTFAVLGRLYRQMIVAGLLLTSLQLKENFDPIKESTLRKDELMRLVKLGGKADYGKYRNILILKSDHSVIDKAWNKTYTMKLNANQWDDYQTNLQYFPDNWPVLAGYKKAKKADLRPDRTEFYLQVRYKGKIKKWKSVGIEEPWPFPLFDTTDVWEYLMKNPN